jgi:hypothetical protein
MVKRRRGPSTLWSLILEDSNKERREQGIFREQIWRPQIQGELAMENSGDLMKASKY